MSAIDFLKNLLKENTEKIKERRTLSKVYQNKSDDFFENLSKNIFTKYQPIFVLSTGRCGTQLLTKVLEKCQLLRSNHTPNPKLFYGMRKFHEEGMDKFDAYCIGVLMARYDLLQESYLLDKIYVETHCKITFSAPHIKNVFKGAKFIHLIRDPKTFAQSAFKTQYYQSHKADLGHIFPFEGIHYENWKNYSLAEKILWNWNETNLYIENFKKTLQDEDIITVFAEDLFSNPNESMRICDFCGESNSNLKIIEKVISRKHNQSKRQSTKGKFFVSDNDLAKMITVKYDKYQ